MKCVCDRKCQVKDDAGGVHLANVGRVMEFKECPEYFTPVDDVTFIDFLEATEDQLLAVKWAFEDAAEAINNAYGIELKRGEDTKKSDVVAQILAARFRAVD